MAARALLIISCLVLVLILSGQGQALVETVVAEWAQVGKSRILLCPLPANETETSLDTCDWSRLDPIDATIRTFNISLVLKSTDDPMSEEKEKYFYSGQGMRTCELTIKNVSEADVTGWECRASRKNSSNVYNGIIRLMQEVMPTKPEILNKEALTNLVEKYMDAPAYSFGNNTINLKCCSHGGRPTPRLSFYIDNTAISEVYFDTDHVPATICILWNNATFGRGDDGAEVRCAQNHQLYHTIESDTQTISVLYGPDISEHKKPGSNKFEVVANPKPDVYATVVQTNHTLTKDIVEFTIELSDDYFNTWIVSWNSISLTKLQYLTQRYNMTIEISIVNPYGHLAFELESEDLFSLPLEEPETFYNATTTPKSTAPEVTTVTPKETNTPPKLTTPEPKMTTIPRMPTIAPELSTLVPKLAIKEEGHPAGLSTAAIITLIVVVAPLVILMIGGLIFYLLRGRGFYLFATFPESETADERRTSTYSTSSTVELASFNFDEDIFHSSNACIQ